MSRDVTTHFKALSNPQRGVYSAPRQGITYFCLPHKKSPLRERGYLAFLLGVYEANSHTTDLLRQCLA